MNSFLQGRIGRRALLSLSVGAVATGAVGCSIDTGKSTGGGQTSQDADAGPEFQFRTDGVTMPSEAVTFRWMDSGDLKAKFIEPVVLALGEQFDNISATYDGAGWDQVNQVVPLGIRNQSAPDVFALPQNVPAQTAINEGWVRPIDELVPDFEDWRAAFPDTALIPGVHIFDGKVYSWPLNSTRRLDKMLFTSDSAMEAAGVDADTIKTWDDLRTAAKEVTASGTPGFLVTGDHLYVVAMYLANTAGWRGIMNDKGLDLSAGRSSFASEEFLSAIEFLKSLQSDGSLVPGFLTLKDADGRAQFPTDVAGMMFNGPWDIRSWKEQSPDFGFSINPLPSPDGSAYTIPFAEVGANLAWVYADTPTPELAGVVMEYLGSVAGQTKMVELTGGTLVSMIPEANDGADAALLDEHAKRAADLAREYMRAAPQLEIRTPDAGAVRLALKPTEPTIETIMQGIFSGQITDVEGTLADLDSRLDAAWDAAFAQAAAEGADVEASMLKFDNWDPAEEYMAADYEALH